jgi:hypothetical protein
MKKALLLALVPLLMATTCNKKEKQYPTYYMDQEFKDYTLFKVGSYWVYQDSATKQIDSVYLYKQEITINDRRKIVDYNYQDVFENLYTSYYNDTIFRNGGAKLKGDTQSYCAYFEGMLTSFINAPYLYFGSANEGTTFYHDGNLIYLKFNDIITIGNTSYSNVKIFELIKESYPLQIKKIFHAKHKGVIRKELFNGQVWNLIRYHVTQ